jgi:hypothetical protein
VYPTSMCTINQCAFGIDRSGSLAEPEGLQSRFQTICIYGAMYGETAIGLGLRCIFTKTFPSYCAPTILLTTRRVDSHPAQVDMAPVASRSSVGLLHVSIRDKEAAPKEPLPQQRFINYTDRQFDCEKKSDSTKHGSIRSRNPPLSIQTPKAPVLHTVRNPSMNTSHRPHRPARIQHHLHPDLHQPPQQWGNGMCSFRQPVSCFVRRPRSA